MTEPPAAVLRIEPHALPGLRAAYTEAVEWLRPVVARARRDAVMTEPWLGDPISLAVMRTYNARFAGGDGSAYQHLNTYLEQLIQIRDTLAEMEDAYRRTEGDNSALWGRLA